MLRIAAASENGSVSAHFGHCREFMLFDTEDGQIVREETIPSPGHDYGSLPDFLRDKGAEVIITGGMGQGAADRFAALGFVVIIGAEGKAREAAERYLKGELKSRGPICQQHRHGAGGPGPKH